jgi:hypothetical protein
VSFVVCVVLCPVFRFIVVLFCVMCVICVLCLIVVPLAPGKNSFAFQTNNNNINNNNLQNRKTHRPVIWEIVSSVSNEPRASIFRVEKYSVV